MLENPGGDAGAHSPHRGWGNFVCVLFHGFRLFAPLRRRGPSARRTFGTLGQPTNDRLLRERIESSLLVRFDIVDDVLGADRVAKYDEIREDNRFNGDRGRFRRKSQLILEYGPGRSVEGMKDEGLVGGDGEAQREGQ